MILSNADIWVGDGTRRKGHVRVEGGVLLAVEDGAYHGSEEVIDLEGMALSPGLVDSMVLGGFGFSLQTDDVRKILQRYIRLGVTSCQVCAGGDDWDRMAEVERNVARALADPYPDSSRLLGIYWEGPFKHPEFCGAALSDHCRAGTKENLDRMREEFGKTMTMVTVSPGIDGDVEAVRFFRDQGYPVTMSHSAAPAERVEACVEAGSTILGHCWNNHSGALIEPGVQQPTLEHVSLTDERVQWIHLICDGVHVHPVVVRLVHRCRGTESICLVTDAVPLAGAPDGGFTANDGRTGFYKKDGVGRTESGGLCGSGLLLPDHLRNFVRFTGVPPWEAVRTVSYNPAASLGLSEEIGLIAPGRKADLAIWNEELRLKRVFKEGVEMPVDDFAEVEVGNA